jgi:hypothetical protein
MKKTALVILAALMPMGAHAASAEDPVKRVMDITVSRLKPEGAVSDYFEKRYLNADYSKAFVAVYHRAEKYPAYDDGSSNPFDYDVITSSQDGCPLKDLKIAKGGERNGVTTVDVSFRLWDCAETAAEKARISEVKFDVVMEKGKPRINDIHRKDEDGKWNSLVGEMEDNIKTGEAQK